MASCLACAAMDIGYLQHLDGHRHSTKSRGESGLPWKTPGLHTKSLCVPKATFADVLCMRLTQR